MKYECCKVWSYMDFFSFYFKLFKKKIWNNEEINVKERKWLILLFILGWEVIDGREKM